MKKKIKPLFSGSYFKKGGYSVGLILTVLAITVLINLLVNRVPSDLRKLDISSNKIYTVGDVTKKALQNLDKDVSIFVIAEPDSVDSRITKLMENYRALSSHIRIETIDPVLHPGAAGEYQAEENSIVVRCEDTDRQQVISLDDMIQFDQMSYYYYGQYKETEFDGEGKLTSAIDYVISENSKTIYVSQGHREAELSAQLTDLIGKANMDINSVNLLKENGVPKDCDLLIINAPEADLAEDEAAMLESYLSEGGKLIVLLGSADAATPNLDGILKTRGITVAGGYVADTQNFYRSSYYEFFAAPDTSNEICEGLGSQDLTLVMAARGMTLSAPEREGITTEAFLSTSDQAYAVTGAEETLENAAAYVLGAASSEALSDGKTGRLIVFSAASLIDTQITSRYTNLANLDIFMSAVRWNFDDVSNISIPAKSLETAYNSIPSGGAWGLVFIALIPLSILITGFVVWTRRRRA